jgi:hypothetical protein
MSNKISRVVVFALILHLYKQISVFFYLPVSTSTLPRARRNAGQQPSTAKLLFNMCVKCASLLALLMLPLDMVAFLSFLSSSFTILTLYNKRPNVQRTIREGRDSFLKATSKIKDSFFNDNI